LHSDWSIYFAATGIRLFLRIQTLLAANRRADSTTRASSSALRCACVKRVTLGTLHACVTCMASSARPRSQASSGVAGAWFHWGVLCPTTRMVQSIASMRSLPKVKHPWLADRVNTDGDGALGQKLALQNQRRQRVFNALLDGALEGPRAVHGVKAHLGQLG
jgi:hypothetical protein